MNNQNNDQYPINQSSNQSNYVQNQDSTTIRDRKIEDNDPLKNKNVKLPKKDIVNMKQIDENDFAANFNDKLKAKNLQIDLSYFTKIKKLGVGSFGEVFLVENIHTHQQFAAKVSKQRIDQFHKQSDFFNEIELYSKIDHPAILKLQGYSLHDFDGKPYPTMILDYIPNKTLADFFHKNRKSEEFFNELRSKKYIILIGIALGMKFLHSIGIIHRDLKPENILLDENLYPKICDFGISIVSDDELLKKQKSRAGTPIYLAPEIAFYEAPYSDKVDVYAFALIIYELITGKEPFSLKDYSSKFDIWKAIEKGVRPDLSIIPDLQIRLLIGRCWSRDPTERPSFDQIYEMIYDSRSSYGCDGFDSIDYYDYLNEKGHFSTFTKENIKEFADNGDIEAIKSYTFMLLRTDIPQDTEKAIYYLKKGAELNDTECIYRYAFFLFKSENILDKKRANELLKKLADDGYEKAMIDYGANLTFGLGCEINYDEALKYFKIAANLKNATALFNLGRMHYTGRGTKVDKLLASQYYQLSADLGNKDAMYEYARMLYSGDGIEKDLIKSEDYFNMAAFQMDISAMMYLGIMYIDGSIQFNPEKAKYWLNKCGEIGNNKAFCTYIDTMFTKIDGQYDRKLITLLIKQLKSQMPTNEQSMNTLIPQNDDLAKHPQDFLVSVSNCSCSNIINNNNINLQTHKAGQIKKIKINVYQSIVFDENQFSNSIAIADKYIPKSIKNNFDDHARTLDGIIKTNIIQRDDPNNVCTYYIFPSIFQKQLFNYYICQIMTKNKYECMNIHGNNCYMHFDEKMIPPKELPIFIKYLESLQEIKDIKRNIFDGNKIATYFIVHPNDQDKVKSLLKEFLLKKKLIFDTSIYPLENDIIFKENLLINEKTDFDVIINEITSIRTKNSIVPISIQRDKLYFYNESSINNLFQISSFICFKNRIEKMEALNHINEIVYKGKNNILKCDLDLYYASIDSDGISAFMRKSVPEIFQSTEGVVDFQPNVLSIESPIHRTYIGFDSMENLKNGYLRYYHLFNVYLGHKSQTKFFFQKKGLFYLDFCVESQQNTQKVADFVSDLVCDYQMNCSEKTKYHYITISFLGFKSNDDLIKAKNRIESNNEIKKLLYFLDVYHNDFITEKADYKESYLFYDSL